MLGPCDLFERGSYGTKVNMKRVQYCIAALSQGAIKLEQGHENLSDETVLRDE